MTAEKQKTIKPPFMTAGHSSDNAAAFFSWRAPPHDAPSLSVVAPMMNEEGAVQSLVSEISAALESVFHEIIIVDDGSTDGTLAALKKARAAHPQLRIIRHRRRAGQSRAIRTGVLAARAAIIATLDGDGQNDIAYVETPHLGMTMRIVTLRDGELEIEVPEAEVA